MQYINQCRLNLFFNKFLVRAFFKITQHSKTENHPFIMLMKKEPDSQDNTRPDDLNNYKLHLCICEKPIYFVFLQMLSARRAGTLYEKS